MRKIDGHIVNACNREISIAVLDEPGIGGACAEYLVTVNAKAGYQVYPIRFQSGPVADGVNGLTHEVLLAILIDRLEDFQKGFYACEENRLALTCLRTARDAMKARTTQRQARDVEGTHAA